MAFGLHGDLAVSIARATTCHHCSQWLTALWLSVGLVAVVLAYGCRRGGSVVDTAPKPPAARGTITGTVTGAEGNSSVSRRHVAIDVVSGERRTVETSSTGGFTIKLPAGKYRVELPLRDGETLLKRPDLVDLNHGDIDSHIEFVLGTARVLRPRGPAYRIDNGLGSPIA